MARLVEHLAGEEELHLVKVMVDAPQPLGRQVGGDELDLGQRRAQLADGTLDIVGKRLERVPWDIAGDLQPKPTFRPDLSRGTITINTAHGRGATPPPVHRPPGAVRQSVAPVIAAPSRLGLLSMSFDA